MLLEVLSSQKTVKHDAGIRKGNGLQQLRLDSSGIRCTSRPTGRDQSPVKSAMCGQILSKST
jgi:hypothetical protein